MVSLLKSKSQNTLSVGWSNCQKGNIMIGKLVIIKNKDSIYHGEWGIIKHFDGEYYHIAIADDSKNLVIFERDEFTVRRKDFRNN